MKKRIFSMIFAIVMVMGLVPGFAITASAADGTTWDGSTVATAYAGGTGTEADPYIIATAGQLIYFRNQVNGGQSYNGKYFRLDADLDMAGKDFGDAIGNTKNYVNRNFNGHFDGGNHKISNLTIGNANGYSALFGNVGWNNQEVIIKNLTLVNVNVNRTATNYGAAALVGNAGYLKLENCTVESGTVQCNKFTAGGFVANAGSASAISLTIIDCVNRANITQTGDTGNGAGGIVGQGCNQSGNGVTIITGCINYGDVSGRSYAAGIIGNAYVATVEKCANYGDISAIGTASGTFQKIAKAAGILVSGADEVTTIANCYNVGDISSDGTLLTTNAGGAAGIAAFNKSSNVNKTIINCHNVGTVTSTNGYPIGLRSKSITNAFYLNTTSKNNSAATQKTAEEFADGRVYDLLQGANTDQIWGQTIGTDSYPVFFNGSNSPKPAHEHSWTYTAVDTDSDNMNDTITASCSNTDGSCPDTDGGSVTIKAPAGTLVYSGTAQNAILDGSFTTGVSNNDIVITYKDNKSPTNVGTYTAEITLEGATAGVTYSITPKDVSIKADDQTIIYGENPNANDVTVSGLIDGHTAAGVKLTPDITNVGTGTITPSAAVIMNGTEDVSANYRISYTSGTLTISEASMTGVNASGYTNAYDGNSHGITVTAPAGSTVTYSTDNVTYSAVNPTYRDVCEITVYYKVEKENYETVTGSAVVKITPLDISSAQVTLGDALTYDGSEQTQTVSEVKVGDLTVDNDAYTVTNNTATNAGTAYKLTVTAKENTNFTGSVMADYAIAQKEVSVSAGTYKVSKIYDGTTNAGMASGALEISGILDADSGVTVKAVPNAYSGANVGQQSTVNVSLSLNGDSNNNYVLTSKTVSVPCEITKKDIAIESAVVSDKEYNGTNAAEVTSVTFKDVAAGEALAIGTDYTVTSAVFPDANADAEKQTVTIFVTLNDSTKANNYNLTNGSGFDVENAAKINKSDYPNAITADTTVRANKTQNNLTFDITDKLNGIDGAAIKSVAYGSNDKNLLAGTPTVSGMIITYHVNNGTAVGDTGVIEITVSSTNYKDYVVALTVTTTGKDTLSVTGVKMDSEAYTYGGTAVGYDNTALSVTGTTGVAFDNNELEYVYSGTLADGSTYAESTVAPTKAGTYTLTVRVPSDNLDYTGKQEISFAIGAKKITRPAQASAVVYNGSEQTYGVASTAEYTVIGGVQKNANENGYDVVISLTDKFNTVWDSGTNGDLTHKFIIHKKGITVTADDKEAYVGNRHPVFTYTTDGLIGSDKLTTAPAFTTDADMDRVGTYTITASGADAGGNYAISYVSGTLNVKMFLLPVVILKEDIEIADDITGGKVSASEEHAYNGDTITITAVPDAEYELNALTVTDSRGNVIDVTKESDTRYSFKMPGYDVKIDAEFAKVEAPAPADPIVDCPRDNTCPMHGYTDLDRTEWYHDGVHFCIENNLMNGFEDRTFQPDTTTTRAMIVTILWRLEGSPVVNYAMSFKDVTADAWYTEAVRWAQASKIVLGYSDEAFGPDDVITREQLAAILYRYEQYKGGGFTGAWMIRMDYADLADVSDWAYEAMCWMNMKSVVNGKPGKILDPKGSATRAEAAVMLYRYCEVSGKGD